LDSKIDSISVEVNNEPEFLLDDAIFGENPKPSDTFSKIEFYIASNDSDPAFTIDTINNNEWTIVSQDIKESGLGRTEYEFVITDEHLE